MTQKDFTISTLFDYYAPLLGENQKQAIEYYYNDDLSLSEIAELMDMTRQGARSLIKNGEEKLLEFEEKLGLSSRFAKIDNACERLLPYLSDNDGALKIIKEIQSEIQ